MPTITSAAYDASTGELTVTGTGFTVISGNGNDIDVTKLSITGDSTTYALTSDGVDVTNGTSFTVTLNPTDKAAIQSRINKDGTTSNGSVTYNLVADEDWERGTDPAVTIADTTSNGITAINRTPTFTNLNGDSVAWVNSGTVTLDASGNGSATLGDKYFEALSSGEWNGATLTIQRVTSGGGGGADANTKDLFSFVNNGVFDLQPGNEFSTYISQTIADANAAHQNATGALNATGDDGWFARWTYTYASNTLSIQFGPTGSGDGTSITRRPPRWCRRSFGISPMPPPRPMAMPSFAIPYLTVPAAPPPT